jgi:uncharacterized protein (TIGR02145 family)
MINSTQRYRLITKVQLLIWTLMFHGVFTQDISNINQSIEDGRIRITFDLHGDSFLRYDIILSAEKGTDIIQPTAVAGDLYKVSPGANKLIWWEPYLEGKTLNGWLISIQIRSIITIKDIDGNTYNTLVIGEQVWLNENLKVSRYRNGDQISTGCTNSEWFNNSLTKTGAYAVYNNNMTNSVYGLLYNWYAVDDDRGICPDGWSVPSNKKLLELGKYLSMIYSKSNTNAPTLLKGFRNRQGQFDIGSFGYIWSSTEAISQFAQARSVSYSKSTVYRSWRHRSEGYFVRCLKDD